MTAYILKRLLATIPAIAVVAVLVFMLLRLTPGDPAAILAGDAASPEQIAQIRANLGLEEPLLVQFGIWLKQMALGDLGESFYFKIRVIDLIGQRLEPTLSLAALTIVIAVLGFCTARCTRSMALWRMVRSRIDGFFSDGFFRPGFCTGLYTDLAFIGEAWLVPGAGL
jgi:peptide/nickel transport system permease protein